MIPVTALLTAVTYPLECYLPGFKDKSATPVADVCSASVLGFAGYLTWAQCDGPPAF